MWKTTNVMGYPFINATKEELDANLIERINNKRRTFLVTANPEIVMQARQNEEFSMLLREADGITPDGTGIIMAGRILGTPLKERLTGFDLVQRLFARSVQEGWSFYLLGTKREVLEEAIMVAKQRFPGIKIAGYHDGYFQDDGPILEEIQRTQPDIVLVGLGSPKQEKWIHLHKNDLPPGLYMGVGGSFDGLAGRIKRAPESWQKLNIEWLYRLIQEPSRWRRMLALPHFLVKVYQRKLSGKAGKY